MARDKKESDIRRKLSQVMKMVLDTGKEKDMTSSDMREEAFEVLSEFACGEQIKIPRWRIDMYTGHVFSKANGSIPTPKMYEEYQRNADTFAYTVIADEFPRESELNARA